MSIVAETRQLTLHPQAIYHFIKGQAGTLAKAMAESVMNAVDAFASKVTITISLSGYTIEDDGIGFTSREEIIAWFETLGWPHEEGNHRTFGKFGMGRAQQWAFASTVWHTNNFLMDVNVPKTGLDYQLQEVAPRKGTRIEGKFYKALSFSDVQACVAELTRLVKYSPGLIFVNGKVVNTDPSTEVWDLETDEAYFRFDKGHVLDVYNVGVHVNNFGKWAFKTAGVVCTKKALALNVARNDILRADCKVWPLIFARFPTKQVKSSEPAVKRPKDSELQLQARRVKSGELSLEAALGLMPHLLVTVRNRAVPFYDLKSNWLFREVCVVPPGDEVGIRAMQMRLGLALSNKNLEAWGVSSVDELRTVFLGALTASDDKTRLEARLWSESSAQAFPSLAMKRNTFKLAELPNLERLMYSPLNSAVMPLTRQFIKLLPKLMPKDDLPDVPNYRAALGDAEGCKAWMDDADTIVVRVKDLMTALESGIPAVLKLGHTILFDGLSSKLPESVRKAGMLQLSLETTAMGDFALALYAAYLRARRCMKLPIELKTLKQMESLGVDLSELADEPTAEPEPVAV
jgi:hypothetical protein